MRGEQKEMEGTSKGNGKEFAPSFRRGGEDKERAETFSASVADDVSAAGRGIPELNAAIQARASQRVAVGLGRERDPHTQDRDPANCLATSLASQGLAQTIKPLSEPARGHCCIMASLGQMIKAQLKCAKCLCH